MIKLLWFQLCVRVGKREREKENKIFVAWQLRDLQFTTNTSSEQLWVNNSCCPSNPQFSMSSKSGKSIYTMIVTYAYPLFPIDYYPGTGQPNAPPPPYQPTMGPYQGQQPPPPGLYPPPPPPGDYNYTYGQQQPPPAPGQTVFTQQPQYQTQPPNHVIIHEEQRRGFGAEECCLCALCAFCCGICLNCN